MKKSTRNRRIVVVLEENPQLTLQQIADELKLTRQRIHMITQEFGVDNKERLRKRRELRKQAEDKRLSEKYGFWKIGKHNTTRLIRLWLKEINHNYCCNCHQAKPLTEFAHESRVCKACVSRRASIHWRRKNGLPDDYVGRKGPLRVD